MIIAELDVMYKLHITEANIIRMVGLLLKEHYYIKSFLILVLYHNIKGIIMNLEVDMFAMTDP